MTSKAQLAELADVLTRPRLRRFLDADEAAVIVWNMDARALIISMPPSVNLSPDP